MLKGTTKQKHDKNDTEQQYAIPQAGQALIFPLNHGHQRPLLLQPACPKARR